MILFIVMSGVVAFGLLAIGLAHPPHPPVIGVWSDDAERALLNDARVRCGW